MDITVDHQVHVHPCKCGSKDIISYGNIHRPSWAWHVPQGKRRPCKIIYQRKRFMCNICGSTFQESIPWIYHDSHLTVPLAECIEVDLRTIMTKKGIARANRVSVHFVNEYKLQFFGQACTDQPSTAWQGGDAQMASEATRNPIGGF